MQRGVIEGLRERWPAIQPSVEYLDLKRFPDRRNESNFVGYVARKYEHVQFDLSIFLDDAGRKAAEAHPYLVDYAPIVFCGAANRPDGRYTTFTNATGVIEEPALADNLRLMDRLIPNLRKIHVLSEDHSFRGVRAQAEMVFAERPVELELLPPMSREEIIAYVKALDPGDALLWHALQFDKDRRLIPPAFRRTLTEHSAAPLFVCYETGHGIGLGGYVLSAYEHGRLAAGLAKRVLAGESAASIPLVVGEEVSLLIDHEQMRRFGIPESRLPPGAIVVNRPPSMLRRYRTALFGVGGFAVGLSLLALFFFRANAKRRQLFDAASDAIFVSDLRARLTDVNQAACQMLGYSREELLGRSFAELVDPADLKASPFQLKEVLEGGTLRSRRRLLRRDGSVVVADCHTNRSAGGRLQGIIRDITEHARAEQALRESEERFRSVAEAVEDLVYEWQPDTDAVWRSSNSGHFLGFAPEEIQPTGRWWFEHIHPDDAEAVGRQFREALAKDDEFSIEYRMIQSDGSTLEVWDKGRIIRDADGKVTKVIGGTTNLTERRQLEAQLRQAQKMEAIGTLAGGIAHDFNNILSGVLGNADLLRMELPADHSGHESIREILKATERARSLIRQILTFSRRDDEPRQSVDLGSTVREAHRLLRSTIPQAVDVRLDSPATLPAVNADPTQIYQAIMNLATNAWQALDGKPGRIDILLDEVTLDADTAPPLGLQPGRHLRLRVRDDGPGMSPQIRERIFDPFFTTKRQEHGTGLGLAVVHGIVQNHKGAIHVNSEPGEGAEFTIHLPVVAAAAPADLARRLQFPSGEGRRILMVDDEELLLNTGSRILAHLGYEAQTFLSAREALATFTADPARWDAVLTDLSMPEMSGLELAEKIFQIAPTARVILISGYLGDMDTEEYQQKGFRAVLQKPVDATTLGNALGKVFGLEQPTDPAAL